MNRFLQLHLLTFYPPANLNRDDTGRPKTAIIGGANRLRISSQALKRAWRTSDLFKTKLEGHLAERTQRLGDILLEHLQKKGLDTAASKQAARTIAGVFGKLKKEDDAHPERIEQLAFISPEEKEVAIALAEKLAAGEKIEPEAADLLRKIDGAADIAMFGRMLAADPEYNRDASVQVAHAFTTHAVAVEDDFYTAVDDLKLPSEDAGAGFIGEAGFGSGVFYLYICIDRKLLEKNLGGNADLAAEAIAALIEAAATVAPGGKQASFASRAQAHYVLAEKGDAQPRTLAGAFAEPITGEQLVGSVTKLRDWRDAMNSGYGAPGSEEEFLAGKKGSLASILAFCRAP